jgi:predicted transglutaminase-like cysteine proteinase
LANIFRSKFVARSTGIAISLLAGLYGTSASVLAAPKLKTSQAEKPDVVAFMPSLPAAEERPSASMPRYFSINDVVAKLDGQKANKASSTQSTRIAALDMSAPTTDAGTSPTRTPPQSEEPFGLATFRAPEGALWVKWRKLNAEMEAEAQVLTQCRADPKHCSSAAAQKYLVLIDEGRHLPERAKIDRINHAINAAIRYTSDLDQFGVPDLWSAPLATLGTGQGDCEDYAIAKYAALRDAGFSSDDLRLIIVRDRVARQDHAVVGVRHDGRWLMLDNRHEVILEQKDTWYFTPMFALDRNGVKLFAAPYDNAPANAPELVASGPANAIELASTGQPDKAGNDALGLRLDTFDPPTLRGRQ